MFGPKITVAEHEQALDDLHSVVDDLREQLDEVVRIQAEPNEWLESVMTKRVLIHLKDDNTIDGSLVARMDDGIVLRAAQLLSPNNLPTPMAGEVFVPRENVAFAQLDG